MKSANNLDSRIAKAYSHIRSYDLREIDNPDTYSPERLSYTNRLDRIVELIASVMPPPARIVDWGCAQGNASLRLAEMNYDVCAVDLRPEYLLYSRAKYGYGKINWVAASLEAGCIRAESVDGVLLCEILEHCAYPERLLGEVLPTVRGGGVILVTTPNGGYIRNKLPSFACIRQQDRHVLAERQFGPDGSDHLFLFGREELEGIVPVGGRVVSSGYLGCSLFSAKLRPLVRRLSPNTLGKCVRMLERCDAVNRRLSPGLYCMYMKS